MAFTYTWDNTFEEAPTNANYGYEIDDYIRRVQIATRERMEIDHIWKVGATDGYHKKSTFLATTKPTAVVGYGIVYTKDVSAKVELFAEDEDGDEIQITEGGRLGSGFPSGTKMIFYQDTAPANWTIDATVDDKLLFITKGSAASGETGGGAHSTGTWTQPNHVHTGPSHTHTTGDVTLTAAQSGVPAHTHTVPRYDSGSSAYAVQSAPCGTTTSNTGANVAANAAEAHNHGATGAGGTANTGNGATANTWRPAAYCAIVATKD